MQTPFANSLARLWRRGLSPACLGYTVLRLALGMSMFIHGAGRLPKIGAFTDATVKMFAGSPLPTFAVVAFARVTPPVEALVGLLVLFGLATRWGLTLGGLWIVALIFGSALIEKYELVGFQLVYALVFYQLLLRMPDNVWSLDQLFFGGKPPLPGIGDADPAVVSVVVRYHLRPGAFEGARGLFAAHVRDSRADDGCLEFTARQSEAEPEWVTLTEVWRDPAALQTHRASKHYVRLRAEMQPLLAEDPQVQPGRLIG